ncbi:MAG: hydrogenase maturation protease [Clostridia bacterium]|jgi:hydrogenase maturation protease|nr:hydrogenase maturation protease [Clostridia bacterium]MDN5322651.1 hydrogenase maturation protease [Clostridia bacterium]
MKKSIVVGLGNPILSDDGVGNKIAEILKIQVSSEVEVVEATLAGFNLLELLAGYDTAILVDAIQTKGGKVGDIYKLNKDDLAFSQRLASVHDINLYTAWQLGEQLGIKLPDKLVIFAIEVEDVLTFSENLTPKVEAVVPKVCEMVLNELT